MINLARSIIAPADMDRDRNLEALEGLPPSVGLCCDRIAPMDVKDEIDATLVKLREMLKALESGDLHIDAPFKGRTEAKVADLRRQIAQYQALLDKQYAERS